MHHIDPEVVPRVHIRSIIQQHLNQRNVSPETRKVQWSEPIINGLLVDPLGQLSLHDGLLGTLQDHLRHILESLEARQMQRRVSPLVDYVGQGHSETRGEETLQAQGIPCLNEAEHFVSHLLDLQLVQS